MHVPVSWPAPHHTSLARQQHSLDTTGGVCPLQLWDDLCEALRVREISTEDVSNKASCCRLCWWTVWAQQNMCLAVRRSAIC